MFTCSEQATLFVEGALSIENTGNKFIFCSKILVDTGALVPSGIAVSENFFVEHLGALEDWYKTCVYFVPIQFVNLHVNCKFSV